jgi:hypothetical protein
MLMDYPCLIAASFMSCFRSPGNFRIKRYLIKAPSKKGSSDPHTKKGTGHAG